MTLYRARFPWLLLITIAPAAGASPPFDPTDRYEVRDVQGWTVLVNKALLTESPELAEKTMALLDHQLYQVVHKVPPAAVSKLRKVRIWVEKDEPHHPCMVYHPDPGWLREHDMNPEKARCVEVSNAVNFLSWTKEQPWMVLHELAHAYHDQFLEGGHGNAEVKGAFKKAAEGKRYASVLHFNGKEIPAYAATNPMEYFAESTEAFFGANDFYPFVRAELRRHDPEMERLLVTLWGAH